MVWGLTLEAGWLFLTGSRFWAAPSEDARLPGPQGPGMTLSPHLPTAEGDYSFPCSEPQFPFPVVVHLLCPVRLFCNPMDCSMPGFPSLSR